MREKVILSQVIDSGEFKRENELVRLPLSTILTEGTHNGITFLREEIEKAKFKDVFPLTLNHSRNVEDEVGWWESARVEDGKFRAVPVINLQTVKGKAALGYVENRFRAGLTPEVSIEVWLTLEKKEGKTFAKDLEIEKASLVDRGANSPDDGAGIGLQRIDFGYIPGNPKGYGKDESGLWSRPRLRDFTSKNWDELSDSEKRAIASCFAWSKNNPPESFGDLKLPHHKPNGTLSWAGVKAAMGALLGARGGVDIPQADKGKVYNHLAKHYRDFGKEPPKVSFSDDGGILEVVFMENEEIKEEIEVKEVSKEELNVAENETKEEIIENEPDYKVLAEELTVKVQQLEEELKQVKARLMAYVEAEREALIIEIKQFNSDYPVDGKSVEELRALLEFAKGIKLNSGRKSLVVSPEKGITDPVKEYEFRIKRKLEELRKEE